MSRVYGVSFTENTKRVAYVKADSERQAEKLFQQGKGSILEEFDENVGMDIHDVFEVDED